MVVRNRQDHPSSRLPIARAKSPRPRLIFLGLLFLLLPFLLTTPAKAQGTPTTKVTPGYFGLMMNNAEGFTSGDWVGEWGPGGLLPEPINYGLFRVWDSFQAQWPDIEQTNGSYTWGTLDADLAYVHDNNKYAKVMYTLNRTPNWALTPTDVTANCLTTPGQPACDKRCNDYNNYTNSTLPGSMPGQCYPPLDLNPDGTGTDAIWQTWITALSNHALYDCNHGLACIQYYEIWNEIHRNGQGFSFPTQVENYPTAPYMFNPCPSDPTKVAECNSYFGSFAQIVRMIQDARCIIMGSTAIAEIDNAGMGGVGHSAPCNEPGIQAPGSVYPAQIVAPSIGTAQGEQLNTLQDILYCSVSGTVTTSPNWCNTTTDAAADIDITNFHIKPGNFAYLDDQGSGLYMETEMLSLYCNIFGTSAPGGECTPYYDGASFLKGPERAKPMWNGESGYSGQTTDGWKGAGPECNATDHWNCPYTISTLADQQAAFIARYALTQWSLGIQSLNWYEYDIGNVLDGSANNGTYAAGDPALAYSSIYSWMVNKTMTSPCSSSGTLNDRWQCEFTDSSGNLTAALWNANSAYNCPINAQQGRYCNTINSTGLSASWTYYKDLFGHECPISGNAVEISNLPVLLETSQTQTTEGGCGS